MSTVYYAESLSFACPFIVKKVQVRSASGTEALAVSQLMREIDTLKHLTHPGMIGLVDAFRTEDALYLVTEYAEGITLSALLAQKGCRISGQTMLDWGAQLLDVLGYLHTRKTPLIYRDLKPSNIILQKNGRIRLIDYGTVLLASEKNTDLLGTEGYAAPEQYETGSVLQPSADIFSFGKTMQKLLPLVPRTEVPFGLKNILRRCTRKRRMFRYASCATLLYDWLDPVRRSVLTMLIHALELVFLCGLCCLLSARLLPGITAGNPAVPVMMLTFAAAALILLRTPALLRHFFHIDALLVVRRMIRSARINGVLSLNRYTRAGKYLDKQDVALPLDAAATDVRIDLTNARVNFIVMDGFRIEKDIMLTAKEQYVVSS